MNLFIYIGNLQTTDMGMFYCSDKKGFYCFFSKPCVRNIRYNNNENDDMTHKAKENKGQLVASFVHKVNVISNQSIGRPQ